MLGKFAANASAVGSDVTLVVALIGVAGVIIAAVITARATIKAAKLHREREKDKSDLPPIKIAAAQPETDPGIGASTRAAPVRRPAPESSPKEIKDSEPLRSIEAKRPYEGLRGDELDAEFIMDVMKNNAGSIDQFKVDDFREGNR